MPSTNVEVDLLQWSNFKDRIQMFKALYGEESINGWINGFGWCAGLHDTRCLVTGSVLILKK